MELQSHYERFQEANVEVVSLVVAPIKQVEGWCERTGIGYPMLADSEHSVSEAYGVYDLLGYGLAAPSVFVIDTDGDILWNHVGRRIGERVEVEEILEHLPR